MFLCGKLGRFPFSVLRKIRIIKYWYKISKSPNSLMYKLLCNYTENDPFFVIHGSVTLSNYYVRWGRGTTVSSASLQKCTLTCIYFRSIIIYVKLYVTVWLPVQLLTTNKLLNFHEER